MVEAVTCNESSPDHMAHAYIPKVASFSLGRRQRGNAAIEIKPQMVAVAASPKELVDLHVAVDCGRLIEEIGVKVKGVEGGNYRGVKGQGVTRLCLRCKT